MKRAPAKQIPELSEKDKERFWSKVNKRPDGVWEWTAAKVGKYGVFKLGNKMMYAHRISWALQERLEGRPGIIPEGFDVLHKIDVSDDLCDVRDLWLGTSVDNIRDRCDKGRSAMGDKNGSRLHPERLNPPRGDKSGPRLHPESFQGERNGRAKLSESDVVKILRSREAGIRKIKGASKTYKQLADEFSVSVGTISAVLHRELWKHVSS